MYNIVRIGDRDVPMLSKATVDFYFKSIFGEDPIRIQAKSGSDEGAMIDLMLKMGFVMAKFAESTHRKDMMTLNEDAFFEWLDGFERADLYAVLDDIQATYESQAIAGSKAKKNNEEPTET